MTNLKTESLSIRVPIEVKEKFLKLFDESSTGSKSELFQQLMDKYNDKSEEPIIIDAEDLSPNLDDKTTDVVVKKPIEVKKQIIYDVDEPVEISKEIIEDIIEPVLETIPGEKEEIEQQDIEILVKLNPVQAFALRETILNDGFIKEVNKVVNKIDTAKDTSMFGNSLYSGAYKGIFTTLDLDNENEESINENMGTTLVNHFISSIVFGSYDLYTPITQSMLKEFLKEEFISDNKNEE